MIGIALLTLGWYIRTALSDGKTLLYGAILLLATLFYSYMASLVFKLADPDIVARLVASSLFILTVARKFFPSLSPFHQLAPQQYPVTSGKRYALNLLADGFYTVNFLAIVVFFVIFFQNSPNLGPAKQWGIVLVMLTAYPVRRSLQAALFRKALPGKALAIWGLWGLSVLACGFWLYHFETVPPACYVGFLALPLASGYLIEERWTSSHTETHGYYTLFDNPYFQLLFSNTKFLIHFLLGTGIKVAALAFFTNQLYKANATNFSMHIILFASPLLLFTYIFNNSFGFFHSLWYAQEKCFPTGKKVFASLLQLYKLPLMIDFGISLVFAVWYPGLAPGIALVYLGLLPILLVLSFYWSVLLPQQVHSNVFANFRGSTSFIATLVSLALFFPFALLTERWWLGTIGLLYGAIAWVLYAEMDTSYEEKRRVLFLKLYKW